MTHLVCKMLAFTIQFPNNNPTPPHNQPQTNNQPHQKDQPSTTKDRVQQTQDKHRNTKPQPQPPTKDDPSQEACCLKTQQCTKHIRCSHPSYDPFQQTPKSLRTKHHNQHNNNHANTPHPTTNHTTRSSSRTCFPGVKFIDIPPLSNPPKQHSCSAWATING